MCDSRPVKQRRITRACDDCNKRSIRCRISVQDPRRCQNCFEFSQECTYNRPAKKRGARPLERGLTERRGISTSERSSNTGQLLDDSLSPWKAPKIATQALIMDLVEVYFEVVYPIFPFFHRPKTLKRVARGEYQNDQSFFAAVMAICAIASARVRDGAIFSTEWDLETLRNPQSEIFFTASVDSLPKNLQHASEFDYMRACAILSIVSIQYGNPQSMLHYLGIYHTLQDIGNLHDEVNWPKKAGHIELEERRRLFWSMYTFDVYTAIAWGRIIRSREAQTNVAYPTTLEDELISNEGYHDSSAPTGPVSSATTPSPKPSFCWMYGWNFTTDLYRILEHALDHLRRTRSLNLLSSSIESIFGDAPASESAVLNTILQMYQTLPARFKETPTVTPMSNSREHLFNFQTANIAATIQLVRIVLFAAEDATIEKRCRIASELLKAFSEIPVIYFRAISSPLLHHLASIGSILGSVFEKPLHESSYRQVRSVLISMIQLLSDLESGLFCASDASTRLQSLVEKIDEYMRTQRQSLVPATSFRTGGTQSTLEASQSTVDDMTIGVSPTFVLPQELLEDWTWAFDFTQTSGCDLLTG